MNQFYLNGGLSPPPSLLATSSIPQQITNAYQSGTQWGMSAGYGLLGLVLITSVLNLFIRKA